MKTFKLENDYREYIVEECTAICASIGETERIEALYVHYYAESGEHVEYIVFNWNMPEDEDEFLAMCEDPSAWDGWHGTLKTVVFTEGTYYLPTDSYWNTAFGSESPVCVDRKEAERLYNEWYGAYGANSDDDVAFDDLWREATEDEIAEYGVYNS